MELEQLLKELANHGISESEILKLHKTKTLKFNGIVRYNRGLGPEFVNLRPFEAETIEAAYEKANETASKLFDKKTVIIEVKISPIMEQLSQPLSK
jgi:hypothetical protein